MSFENDEESTGNKRKFRMFRKRFKTQDALFDERKKRKAWNVLEES